MAPLVLASASPRRLELLRRVGLELEVSPAAIDETPQIAERPSACALRLASEKAAVAAAVLPGRWVLAADTVVEVDGIMLGKPEDAASAAAMLAQLAGRTHRVVTGYAIRGPEGASTARAVTTEVDFRDLDPEEIEGYVASGEWRGKAGGYAAQGIAAAFVTAVRGSFTNVIGLPLAEVLADLAQTGAIRADLARGVPA
ncbi:MAG TPA: Maf family protein [Kofleriaceae bacterium]|nr:Maf family protein [Kofleriaceae bacterium]